MIRRSCLPAAALVIALLAPQGATAASGAPAPGTYRCSSYNVSGGGGSARNMPPLVLNADGSYRFSSTRGRWAVRGGRLLLSSSRIWGPGEILGPGTIRFTYDYRGWRQVVTWTCQACAGGDREPAGAAVARGPAHAGASVGVSLTLEFTRSVGGVSGFVIVPAAAARGYTRNAPLPAGAVEGLAWTRGATEVVLQTSRDNQLASGRRYVVFLAWPAEIVPVAVLDLPATTGDYTVRLPATLDGAGVLAGLGE